MSASTPLQITMFHVSDYHKGLPKKPIAQEYGYEYDFFMEYRKANRIKPELEPQAKFKISGLSDDSREWPTLMVPKDEDPYILESDIEKFGIDTSDADIEEMIEFITEYKEQFLEAWENAHTKPSKPWCSFEAMVISNGQPLPPPFVGYTLTYSVNNEDMGYLFGEAIQFVREDEDGTTVVAVANPDYRFVAWSDDKEDMSRKDTNVQNDIDVIAIFSHEGHPYVKPPYFLMFTKSEFDRPSFYTFESYGADIKWSLANEPTYFTIDEDSGTLMIETHWLQPDDYSFYVRAENDLGNDSKLITVRIRASSELSS